MEGMIGVFSVVFIIAITLGIFWLWMLIDVLSQQQDDKVVWFLAVFFLNFFGALLYFFIARNKRLAALRV